MSEEQAIATAVAAWNKGVDDFVALMTPDVEFHAPPDFPDGDVWHGRDAVGALLHEFGSVFGGVTYRVEDAVRGPGGWMLQARESVEQARGMKLEWAEWNVITFDRELISGIWVFYDRDAAMQQAGIA